MRSEASTENEAYYGQVPPGRRDYWRKMAACRHRVATLLDQLARDRPATVLDLGCGDGALLDEIAAALPAASLHGIDLSSAQIEINRARHPEITWHVEDLDREGQLPELAGTADAVVASEVIEHLDRPDAFLRGARVLARAAGRLYLSTQSGPVRETERRVGHRRHYSRDELDQLLRATGWTPIRIWNTGFPFHDLSKWYANRSPDRALAQFGERAYGPRENLICWALRQAFRLNSRSRGAQLFAVAQR